MQVPHGFIPVMLTPFHENGSVDYDGLTRLTHYYLEAGAVGLFANCLSSEMYELDAVERLAITRCVVKAAEGQVPVVATGTFGGPIPQQADFVKRLFDTGVQAVIAITGLLADAEEPDQVWLARAHQLLDLTEAVPMGFYECPVPYKRLISAPQLGELVATGRVVYHKDTCLDLAQVKAKLAAVPGGVPFGLYDAYMEHAVESLRAGSAGLSCIQGNFFPELLVWLCAHYDEAGRQEAVNNVQKFLREQMDLMHSVYPIIAKYALKRRGFPIGLSTRRNVGTWTPELAQQTDALLVRYERLRADWVH